MIDTAHQNTVATLAPEFLLAPILHALTTGKHNDMLRDYRPRIEDALVELDSKTNWLFRNSVGPAVPGPQ